MSALDNVFWSNALGKGEAVAERMKMIDPTAKLSSCQAIVLGISRCSVYYKPHGLCDADLKLMHRYQEAAHGNSACKQPNSVRVAGPGRVQDRAHARGHADEADGDRGARSKVENLETGTGA